MVSVPHSSCLILLLIDLPRIISKCISQESIRTGCIQQLQPLLFSIILITMPPKKKEIKEPDVVVPAGDAKKGKAIFDEQCSACHAMEGDDKGAAAPILGGVVNRKAGSTGFAFSKAMKAAGFSWTEKHLFAYLKNPSKHVPGNKMSFAGLGDEQDRANIIAYLKA